MTVAVPVGPLPGHQAWLAACLESVAAQDAPVDEVVLVLDMADLAPDLLDLANSLFRGRLTVWRAPWLLGVAGAFNAGVGLASNDLVFLQGADDLMEPTCVGRCVEAWERNGRRDAYYWCDVAYLDGREFAHQALPCNAALVTRGLWRETGGFPPETASGAPDAALVSILMVHRPEALVRVADRPLVLVRVHEGQDTAARGPWQGVILETRDVLTRLWAPPAWSGR